MIFFRKRLFLCFLVFFIRVNFILPSEILEEEFVAFVEDFKYGAPPKAQMIFWRFLKEQNKYNSEVFNKFLDEINYYIDGYLDQLYITFEQQYLDCYDKMHKYMASSDDLGGGRAEDLVVTERYLAQKKEKQILKDFLRSKIFPFLDTKLESLVKCDDLEKMFFYPLYNFLFYYKKQLVEINKKKEILSQQAEQASLEARKRMLVNGILRVAYTDFKDKLLKSVSKIKEKIGEGVPLSECLNMLPSRFHDLYYLLQKGAKSPIFKNLEYLSFNLLISVFAQRDKERNILKRVTANAKRIFPFYKDVLAEHGEILKWWEQFKKDSKIECILAYMINKQFEEWDGSDEIDLRFKIKDFFSFLNSYWGGINEPRYRIAKAILKAKLLQIKKRLANLKKNLGKEKNEIVIKMLKHDIISLRSVFSKLKMAKIVYSNLMKYEHWNKSLQLWNVKKETVGFIHPLKMGYLEAQEKWINRFMPRIMNYIYKDYEYRKLLNSGQLAFLLIRILEDKFKLNDPFEVDIYGLVKCIRNSLQQSVKDHYIDDSVIVWKWDEVKNNAKELAEKRRSKEIILLDEATKFFPSKMLTKRRKDKINVIREVFENFERKTNLVARNELVRRIAYEVLGQKFVSEVIQKYVSMFDLKKMALKKEVDFDEVYERLRELFPREDEEVEESVEELEKMKDFEYKKIDTSWCDYFLEKVSVLVNKPVSLLEKTLKPNNMIIIKTISESFDEQYREFIAQIKDLAKKTECFKRKKALPRAPLYD